MEMNLCRLLHPLAQGTRPGEMRDSTTQGDRWMEALELASEFLPERKWYRELSKKSCDVFDVRTQVLLWNNDVGRINVDVFLKKVSRRGVIFLRALPRRCASCRGLVVSVHSRVRIRDVRRLGNNNAINCCQTRQAWLLRSVHDVSMKIF